jgi:hypothetical protein
MIYSKILELPHAVKFFKKMVKQFVWLSTMELLNL